MQKYTKIDKIKFDELLNNKLEESDIEKNFYKKTEKYIKFIKWIPWIKMIWVGNSISMNSSSKESDIDLLIVTDNNSMWLVRILVTFIFQILWVRKNDKYHAGRFCLSFFCTLDWLDFWKFSLEKDPYLYFWILYFKPILDYNNTYNLFLEKNYSWACFWEYKEIIEENKKYVKYRKNTVETRQCLVPTVLNKILKKIFLPKTIKSYNKICTLKEVSLGWKPYWIIINDNMLKFHNWDIRKEIAEKF